jgi:BioD-like phosphotransacetylase family protein
LSKKLYLMGKSGAGKTAIGLAFSLLWKERGNKVGFFKPKTAGNSLQQNHDADIMLFKQVLNMPWEPERMGPLSQESTYIFGQSDHSRLFVNKMVEVLDDCFKEISDNVDITLIEGSSSPSICFSISLDDFSLAKKWKCPVIYITSLRRDNDLDEILFYNNYIQAKGLYLIGNILNDVSPEKMDKVRNVYAPIMKEKGYTVLGIIPSNPLTSFPTVAEYQKALQGEILTGEENMGAIVEGIEIGAMTTEGALRYLRRGLNKAVITGGDRSDMALCALESSTSVLILTGGLYPDVRVISQASEKGIPVILVHYDTYTAINMLQGIAKQIRPDDTESINLIKNEVSRHCRWEKIDEEMHSYSICTERKNNNS